MTAVNHALTGAAIGLLTGEPLVALPAALMSHYICDALPHFGTGLADKIVLKTNAFRNYLMAEAALCAMVVAVLTVLRPSHWVLAAACAFVAAAPDLLSINRYWNVRHGRAWQPGAYTKFASRIQWFERPVGALVEAAWFVAVMAVLAPFFK